MTTQINNAAREIVNTISSTGTATVLFASFSFSTEGGSSVTAYVMDAGDMPAGAAFRAPWRVGRYDSAYQALSMGDLKDEARRYEAPITERSYEVQWEMPTEDGDYGVMGWFWNYTTGRRTLAETAAIYVNAALTYLLDFVSSKAATAADRELYFAAVAAANGGTKEVEACDRLYAKYEDWQFSPVRRALSIAAYYAMGGKGVRLHTPLMDAAAWNAFCYNALYSAGQTEDGGKLYAARRSELAAALLRARR